MSLCHFEHPDVVVVRKHNLIRSLYVGACIGSAVSVGVAARFQRIAAHHPNHVFRHDLAHDEQAFRVGGIVRYRPFLPNLGTGQEIYGGVVALGICLRSLRDVHDHVVWRVVKRPRGHLELDVLRLEPVSVFARPRDFRMPCDRAPVGCVLVVTRHLAPDSTLSRADVLAAD